MTESVQWEKFSRDQFEAGYAAGYGAAMDDGWGEPGHIKEAVTAALDAARGAVEAIPALYKVKGQHETYGPYHEGKADMKDLAISAIDALREKP